MSLGGLGEVDYEVESYLNQLYARGDVLFTAAAGNEGNGSTSFPAAYTAVLSVAAVNSSKGWADFSQYNQDVEIAAPGDAILSTKAYGASEMGGWLRQAAAAGQRLQPLPGCYCCRGRAVRWRQGA